MTQIAHTTRTYASLFPTAAAVDAEMRQLIAVRALYGKPAPTRDEVVATIIAADKLGLRMKSYSRARALTARVDRRRPARCYCVRCTD